MELACALSTSKRSWTRWKILASSYLTLNIFWNFGPDNVFSSFSKSCLSLCDPMDWSTPGFPVHHQRLELAQTHIHRVSDAIQPSHPLSSPSPAFNLSQYQGLFQWVSSSHQVESIGASASANRPSNEYSGLVSFRTDWIHLLAVQGTLKSLL